ncbi:unnamed protein product [Nesidiocoris tenuis]|uniref:Uncharacterized protein n=1 Tax=Nesidiocoris tenuis TaxID=355587 RepID=A0A6H5HCN2_9HEMI|nr:unnamed protein product [Nesidiocoris tenuis]
MNTYSKIEQSARESPGVLGCSPADLPMDNRSPQARHAYLPYVDVRVLCLTFHFDIPFEDIRVVHGIGKGPAVPEIGHSEFDPLVRQRHPIHAKARTPVPMFLLYTYSIHPTIPADGTFPVSYL